MHYNVLSIFVFAHWRSSLIPLINIQWVIKVCCFIFLIMLSWEDSYLNICNTVWGAIVSNDNTKLEPTLGITAQVANRHLLQRKSFGRRKEKSVHCSTKCCKVGYYIFIMGSNMKPSCRLPDHCSALQIEIMPTIKALQC